MHCLGQCFAASGLPAAYCLQDLNRTALPRERFTVHHGLSRGQPDPRCISFSGGHCSIFQMYLFNRLPAPSQTRERRGGHSQGPVTTSTPLHPPVSFSLRHEHQRCDIYPTLLFSSSPLVGFSSVSFRACLGMAGRWTLKGKGTRSPFH